MVKIDREDKGPLKINVGRRLRQLREALALDQKAFGQSVGLSQPRYSMYETGERLLSVPIALDICEEFTVSMDWLYRGDPSALPGDLRERIRQARSIK